MPEFEERQLIMCNEEKEYILNSFARDRYNYQFYPGKKGESCTMIRNNIKGNIGYRIIDNYLEYLGSLEDTRAYLHLNATPPRALLTEDEINFIHALFV